MSDTANTNHPQALPYPYYAPVVYPPMMMVPCMMVPVIPGQVPLQPTVTAASFGGSPDPGQVGNPKSSLSIRDNSANDGEPPEGGGSPDPGNVGGPKSSLSI